ncbi:MAG TPA: response regulator [Candidatus Sulfotelmatobacter sp.]|nr:response regulator [Candidatus Sulfotelmatobacter sp.]
MLVASAVNRSASILPRSSAVPIVFVIDDDASVRESLETLIRLEGWQPETFASAEQFLSRPWPLGPSCLVLDATLPSFGGLEVQRRVAAERLDMPIIFIADHGDIAMTVQAMKAGAAEFLLKPVDENALVTALRQSIAQSAAALEREAELQALRDRYAGLSSREREVMALIASGRLNKQAGSDLGISEITVKAHRGRVMAKMRARSFVDLVHMAVRLGVTSAAWQDQSHLAVPSRTLPH